MATGNFIRISILTKLKLSFVLTLNRFFILLQRGLYSNRKFSSYLFPDKAEARFRVKIKHPHGGEKNKPSFVLTLNRFFILLQRELYGNK